MQEKKVELNNVKTSEQLDLEIEQSRRDFKATIAKAKKYNKLIERQNQEFEIIPPEEILRGCADAIVILDTYDLELLYMDDGEARRSSLKKKIFELTEGCINSMHNDFIKIENV